MKKILECVPNFSEGRNMDTIKQITNAIETVEGVKLLDVDPGKATNRTVVTFVGSPLAVLEAAFQAIKQAAALIDMRQHKGEHPRFGATDVCPLIPIAGITMEEAANYAHQLAKRVGAELGIPIYLYEQAATTPKRKNLATVRAGEYEGLPQKLSSTNWKPDYGPSSFTEAVAKTGVTAIGARDFLVAYNINLNTTSTRRANSVAFDVREAGRVKREGNPITGKIIRDKKGEAVRVPGTLKSVKAIGWYIEEYGIAQISMNLTNISITPIHTAFEEVRKSANKRGLRVTGSELVGLVPLKAMLNAGKYFLSQQQRSSGVSEAEIIKIAVKSLGLDELSEFNPKKKIIEYLLAEEEDRPLVNMTLNDFADETASESPAPGGGSIAAYVGALGVSLGTMVANLSSHKRGWDSKWASYSKWAEQGQAYKKTLLQLVDDDTAAFNQILAAIRMPKGTAQEKASRQKALKAATINAIEVPLQVMRTAFESMVIMAEMAESGLPSSLSDAGVGAACAKAAVKGAYLNVLINTKDLNDAEYVAKTINTANTLLADTENLEAKIWKLVKSKIS